MPVVTSPAARGDQLPLDLMYNVQSGDHEGANFNRIACEVVFFSGCIQ